MRLIHALASTAAAAGLVLLGACGSSTDTTSTPAGSSPAETVPGATGPSGMGSSGMGSSGMGSSGMGSSGMGSSGMGSGGEVTALRTASTAVGTIVTDGRGMTLYMFYNDTKGAATSACTGDCLVAWPPALAGAAMPTASGVTGAVATIATPTGGKQLTLDGWPLYHYAKDTKAGDTSGQAVGGVWWVLDPSGAPIKGDGGSVGGY